MSAVDWSKAPEGAVAYICRLVFGSPFCHWLMARHTHEWVNTDTILAPDFGLPPGVTIRPSSAEAELRAEVERLRHSLHDIQKPGALNHFASRWDQINGILGAAGIEPDPDNWVNDVDTLVTERDQLRAELELVQTSRSAEGDRLDWLLQNLRGSVLRELVGEIGCTSDVAECRSAIDRAAGFSQSSALSIEPIQGTTAAMANLTIRGG